MFLYMYEDMAGLVFAQVDAEDAADGHDAVEEGAVVGCGGGDGDAASLPWYSRGPDFVVS